MGACGDRGPVVSVIVPARNEETTIGACLDAVLGQDLAAPRMEVIVVDGRSDDDTAAVATKRLGASAVGAWQVLANDATSRPANLNRALAAATGPIVCRVDARSRIPKHYVSTCMRLLGDRPDVAMVGGRQLALNPEGTAVGAGIARALNNRWGMGGASYRRASAAGPADTVYLGAFRTAELRAAAGWDEQLLANEDFDLARRMAAAGAVWFDPALEVGYLPRAGLGELSAQYFGFGRWKVRYWRRSSDRPRARQLVAAGGLPVVAGLGVAAVAWRPTRSAAVLAGLSAAAVLEVAGADGPPGGARARAVSVVAMAVIGGSWVGGVWAELIRPSRSLDAAASRLPAER
jgi:succinoglycan biosynthesis protein ExoA